MLDRDAEERIMQDLRYAVRALRRSPSFTLVIVSTLALGIGASTAIFSVFNALTLRKPAVADPDRLITFSYSDAAKEPARLAYPQLVEYRGRLDVFASMAGASMLKRAGGTIDGSGGTSTGSLRIALVTGNFFSTVGIGAAHGRPITEEDDRRATPVIVLSDALWSRAFGRDRAVLSRRLTILGTSYEIVGVMPRSFNGEWSGRVADAWVPIAMQPRLMLERPDLLANPRPAWVNVVARLAPGTTREQADAAVNAVFTNDRRLPAPSATMSAERIAEVARVRLGVEPVADVATPDRRRLGSPLALLLAAVTLVLLITCANASNLLLARATAREREIAVRLALGASCSRLARQFLTESLVLGALGTLGGLLLAIWGADGLVAVLGSSSSPLALDAELDSRMLFFALALGLATTTVFGVAPAVRATRVAPDSSLGGRSRTGSLTQRRTVRVLMVAQVALSAILLVGAGLFTRTLHNLRTADTGYDKSRLVVAWVDPVQAGYSPQQILPLYDTLVQRISALPGVERASVSNRGLFAGLDSASPIVVPGYQPQANDEYWVRWTLVGDDFFSAAGIALRRGRAPGASDVATSQPVVVVNEAFGRKYFGTADAIGRRFHMRHAESPAVEIVGVAADAKHESLRDADGPMIFVPYRQDPSHLSGQIAVLIRSSLTAAALGPAVRRTVHDADRNLPVISVVAADEQLEQILVAERLTATMSSLFGLLAAVLVCAGLYGLLAYSVERRTNEIGVRTALGATRVDVVRLVVRESTAVIMIGLAAGVPVAALVARTVTSKLFGITPVDPITFTAVALLLLVVGIAAAAGPAARAARIEPTQALARE
jgi:predicted permease